MTSSNELVRSVGTGDAVNSLSKSLVLNCKGDVWVGPLDGDKMAGVEEPEGAVVEEDELEL